MNWKELGKQLAVETGIFPDECGVIGCNAGDSELIELKPFDPIDHDATLIQLCPEHTVWAEERNEFAEEMAEQLRQRRREIGQANIDQIQRLAKPIDEPSKDELMGQEGTEISLDGDSQ